MTKKEEQPESSRKPWHRWFGNFFRIPLTPLGLEVHTGYEVMAGPPEADVVIIRKGRKAWTRKQLEFLPDGIRECAAAHIVIEFKHSESVNEDAFFQTAGYRHFYKSSNRLKDEDMQIFLASSKTPVGAALKEYGYVPTGLPGVYQSSLPLLKRIILLSLNDLADEPHNTLVRLLASKKKARMAAEGRLKKMAARFPKELTDYVAEFFRFLYERGGEMDETQTGLTEEEKTQIAQTMISFLPADEKARITRSMLSYLPADEVLSRYSPDDMLARLAPEDMLARLTPDDMLARLTPDDMLARLTPDDMLARLTPDDVLSRYSPDDVLSRYETKDRLAGLTVEEIEAHLQKLRQEEKKDG